MADVRALTVRSLAAWGNILDGDEVIVGAGIETYSGSLALKGACTDGPTAVGVIYDSEHSLATSGARLLSARNQTAVKHGVRREGSLELLDAATLKAGTGVGTKIGTTPSQKIGLFGATPVVQRPFLMRTFTAAGTVDAELRVGINSLLDRLEALGLFDSGGSYGGARSQESVEVSS